MPGNHTVARRLNIAVLLDHLNFFGRGYEGQLRDALCACAGKRGHNLLLLYGGALDAPTPLGAAENAIFHMIRPGDFDGIIVAASLISAYCGTSGVARLVERYKPGKLCSIGFSLPGIPSLVLDNRAGMELAVEHVIREHGRRQPAFLAGTPRNPDAEERFAAYLGMLEKYGIAFDSARVASGHFLPALGRGAMDEILDRGVPFDAVVAANDSMAIGAIQALRNRGLRIPEDVAVTGFDDLTLARLGHPPLTTVAQPFDIFADLALNCIERQVAGEPVPAVIDVPSCFIQRQSCGCSYHTPPRPAIPSDGGAGLLAERVQAFVPTLSDILVTGGDDGRMAAGALVTGLLAEFGGEKGAFQKAVGSLLADFVDDDERHRSLQSAINRLRNEISGQADLQTERALFDGFSLVALSSTAAQVQHRLDLDENYLRLLNVGEQASTACDMASLRDSLIRSLPEAGVRTVILSCLADKTSQQMEPVVCYLDGTVRDLGPGNFPASRLVPPEILAARRINSLLVFPLVHDEDLLGVVAFDHQDGNNAYIAFRNQIAAVLRGIRLHQEVLHKRLEALSVLAGGVAHDLNNALGPLMIMPDIILGQVAKLNVDPAALSELRGDVESIRIACLRATQTIKDLLTLGRQGRTTKLDLDLNGLVRSCVTDSRLTAAANGTKEVSLRLDLAAEALGIHGAETQLARAISNLVRNAVEATEGSCEVAIGTARVQVEKATTGFETIPPGCYAVLTVADKGCGIAPADLGRIFEPYFTKKRTGENSGSGLGLAIVHGVVKEHEGFIDVASTSKVGTTFSLYFPIVDAPKARPNVPAAIAQGHARILVVDDEEIQLRACHRVLTGLGYSVETQKSGEAAFQLFRQASMDRESPFDLVVVDMLLGGAFDGLQVIQEIRSLFPSQKVIIVSGHAPSERVEDAIKHGLPWLAKPYTLDAVASAVADALQESPKT